MTKKIQIEIKAFPDNQLQHPFQVEISEAIMKQFNLEHENVVSLTCSRYSQEVRIVSIKESDLIIHCSYSLLEELYLPKHTFSISLNLSGNNKLSLGPVIAFVTELREKDQSLSLGSVETFCEELALYCEQQGVFFYTCSIKSFNKQEGYVFNNNQWKKTTIPFPQVVHNRIHSRKREHSPEFIRFTELLKEHHVPYFNDHFLNKWEVHEVLQTEDHISPYLPETKLLSNKSDLEEMLAAHQCVFLKPIHGSQGRKIFRITLTDQFQYILDHTTFNGEIEQTHDTFTSLFQSLRTRLYQNGYIIQQGIELYSYNQRPIDFRILCQKTESDLWKVTSAIARVSAKDDFVSNLARGGELKKISEVLTNHFDAKTSNQIKKMINELALEVSNIISSSIDGVFAELGVDLALDNEGNPWIIEINTKPSKNQDPKHLSRKIRPSAKALIQHCVFLAKYPDME